MKKHRHFKICLSYKWLLFLPHANLYVLSAYLVLSTNKQPQIMEREGLTNAKNEHPPFVEMRVGYNSLEECKEMVVVVAC